MKAAPALCPWFLLLSFAGCRPDLVTDDWLVVGPRILAIQAEPAEAAPGTAVTYRALVASADGEMAAENATWRFCTAPKPTTENNIVSTACLDSDSLPLAGTGNPITQATPRDACSRFGPDTPPGGFRPRDADETGGYYLPLRVELPSAKTTFFLSRLLCHLALAPVDVASAFAAEYMPNHNPRLTPIAFSVEGAAARLAAVPAGANMHLFLGWPAEDAETYAYFDPGTQTVVFRRESMRVAWYASAGELQSESTGRDESDPETTTDNVWSAPNTPTPVHFWFVLRDSRGGSSFATYNAVVVPR